MFQCLATVTAICRVAALTSQNQVTKQFHKAKEHGVQWQLNRSYHFTCTPDHVTSQFKWHGNCITATVDTVVLGKVQAAGVSNITVELTTTFLPCILMSETEYNGESCDCFLHPVTLNAAAQYLSAVW